MVISCREHQDSKNLNHVNTIDIVKRKDSITSNIDSFNTPRTIDEAILYFSTKWSENEKNQFKFQQEDIAVSESHFSVGMFIRNQWIRHGRGSLQLTNEFSKIGIFNPDDMSSIILRSLHRKLNNLPLDIQTQTEKYIQFWDEIYKSEQLVDKVTIQTYNKFHVGDRIKIYMYVDTSDGQRSACIIESKEEWKFDPKKDLLITGILKKKYFIENKKSSFFIVRVLNMNFKNTTVFLDSISINKDHEFLIRKLRIE